LPASCDGSIGINRESEMVWKCEKVIHHRLPTRKIRCSNAVDRKIRRKLGNLWLHLIKENVKREKAHEIWLDMNLGAL
jgi:transposase InsO family protein